VSGGIEQIIPARRRDLEAFGIGAVADHRADW